MKARSFVLLLNVSAPPTCPSSRLGLCVHGLALAATLLLISPLAHAQLDVCRAERSDAELSPPVAEDIRAYERCRKQWRDVLPHAEEELRKLAPPKLFACAAAFTAWQCATQADPTNYNAMVQRLAARAELERCNADALAPRLPASELAARLQAERRRTAAASAHASIAIGSVLLAVGGAGLTAVGGVTLYFDSDGLLNNPVGLAIMGASGAAAAGLALSGALVLGLGTRDQR